MLEKALKVFLKTTVLKDTFIWGRDFEHVKKLNIMYKNTMIEFY